ncbi:MAG: PIN domain-containing protein [Candidatus Anammoxibacter sp.]
MKTKDKKKNKIAVELIDNCESVIISTQVLSEVCVNLLKKGKVSEDFICDFIEDAFNSYEIPLLNKHSFLQASKLRTKYNFSYWDSLIVASTLEKNCKIIYTEDMQHNQIVEETLRIINPFLS